MLFSYLFPTKHLKNQLFATKTDKKCVGWGIIMAQWHSIKLINEEGSFYFGKAVQLQWDLRVGWWTVCVCILSWLRHCTSRCPSTRTNMWFTRTNRANYSIRLKGTTYCTSGRPDTHKAVFKNVHKANRWLYCSFWYMIFIQKTISPVSVLDSFFSTARGLTSNISRLWKGGVRRGGSPTREKKKLDRTQELLLAWHHILFLCWQGGVPIHTATWNRREKC